MSELREDRLLDMRGFQCPIPVVKTNQAIKEMQPGQILKVLATDKGALTDMPAWAEDTGNEIAAQTQDGDVLVFYVRKGGS